MYFWTSEAVAAGHPDKAADQIADAVLDSYLKEDPMARVACEVMLTGNRVIVAGEVGTDAKVDVMKVAGDTFSDIYSKQGHWDNAANPGRGYEVINYMQQQSPQIAEAVVGGDEVGAGDQGMMFGLATDETPNKMPLAHYLSLRAVSLLEGSDAFLHDAKSQVTLEYNNDGEVKRVKCVVVSTQHEEGVSLDDLRSKVDEHVLTPLQSEFPNLFDEETGYLVNPAGSWTLGGPIADTGLSGRKITVDNYGPDCPLGGGSYSGKDPTKVDRSAAYAARHVALNLVASGLAKKARVQLAYAIGVAKPVSIRVETFGTAQIGIPYPDEYFAQMVEDVVNLTPEGIIKRLDLRKPIYQATASGGHYGRDFPWEQETLVDSFKEYVGG